MSMDCDGKRIIEIAVRCCGLVLSLSVMVSLMDSGLMDIVMSMIVLFTDTYYKQTRFVKRLKELVC